MNTKETLKILAGSFTVYGAVVACSAAGGAGKPIASALADINAGGSRLKANYYAGSDGSQQFLSTFHDAMRNEDCAFSTASDGTIRCLPAAPTGPGASPSMYSVYYTDAACTQPVIALNNCSGNTAPAYVQVGGAPFGASKNGPSYYKVGSQTTVAMAYQLSYSGPGPAVMGSNTCSSPLSLAPTCTAVPTVLADGGAGDDAGGVPPLFPSPPQVTWPGIESTSTIYSLVEVPPSDFVKATQKTTT
ncbi:MAG: hypothetical protein ACREJ3_05355 [Polyangiaceae bacterium]